MKFLKTNMKDKKRNKNEVLTDNEINQCKTKTIKKVNKFCDLK